VLLAEHAPEATDKVDELDGRVGGDAGLDPCWRLILLDSLGESRGGRGDLADFGVETALPGRDGVDVEADPTLRVVGAGLDLAPRKVARRVEDEAAQYLQSAPAE